MIITQSACRGGEYMDGNKLKAVAMCVPDKKLSWPDAADILCHYATTGNVFPDWLLSYFYQRVTCPFAIQLTAAGSFVT